MKTITIDKRNTTVSVLLVIMLVILIGFDCTQAPLASGGSGTGVGNGAVITGKVVGPDSLPVANAIVRLRTDTYLADTSGKINSGKNDTLSTVYTTSSGEFVFDSVRTVKSYCIEVLGTGNHNDSGTFYKVDVPSTTPLDTIKLQTRVVDPVKILKGSLVINGLPQNAYVQIYGIERIGRTDSSGRFVIEKLPVGKCEHNECEYKLKITVVQSNGSFKVYNSELEVKFDKNQNIVDVELELEDD